MTDFSRLCFFPESDGDINSPEPSPFPGEGAEGLGETLLSANQKEMEVEPMKRPLAYLTAAWSGEPDIDMELAAHYCRLAYEAGFSPICPLLYLPLFLNDSVPEEHKAGIDMRRDMLRRSHTLIVCGGAVDEDVKNDIAVAGRLGIAATTLDGVLAVKGHGDPGHAGH